MHFERLVINHFSFAHYFLLSITVKDSLPGAKVAALDVMVVSPFQQATLERGAREPGYAFHIKWDQKWSKYGEACRA